MRHIRHVLVLTFVVVACSRPNTPSDKVPSSLAGTPARAVASDLFVCPGGYGWAAYGDIVYAPNDTTKPTAEVRPDRCFTSLEQAEGAAFHIHPPPPGGTLVDTIYLVPPDPPILPVCMKAADRLGFAILCPGLVPGTVNSMADCNDDCVFLGTFVLAFSFSGPPEYVGIPGQIGNHLFVMESTVGRDNQVEFLTCPDGRIGADVTVRGTTGHWLTCPANGSGMNSGHVMLVWVEEGLRYAVSLHSDTELNRKIALAIAQGLFPVAG